MAPTESMRQKERERIRDCAEELLAACEAALPELEAYIADCGDYEAPENVKELIETALTVRIAINHARGKS